MNRKKAIKLPAILNNPNTELLPEKYRYGVLRWNNFTHTPIKIVTTVSIFALKFQFVNYKII